MDSLDRDEIRRRDLRRARSVTILLHGIGSATSEDLLEAVAAGYVSSGLGVAAEPRFLGECPPLVAEDKGCDCLVLRPDDGDHFIVALPWAARRIRLARIAFVCAICLMVVGAVASGAFFFRGTIESVSNWLEPWSRRIATYAALGAISFLLGLRSPSPSIVAAPALLITALLIVTSGAWLWIAVTVLIGALWLMATVTVMKALPAVKALSWRLALIGLVAALTFSSGALARFARYYVESVSESSRFDDNNVMMPIATGSNPYLKFEEPHKEAAAPKQDAARVAASAGEPTMDRSYYLNMPPFNRTGTPNVDARGPGRGGNSPAVTAALEEARTHLADKETLDRLIKWNDLVRGLAVVAVCLGFCLFVIFFNWPLDFLLDVLHYAGNLKHRTALQEGTLKAIRWLCDNAPGARIVVVGHSLGSVIATNAIAALPTSEPCLRRMALVTLGSPLNYLHRLFPACVQSARALADVLCPRVSWINLWRTRDPIGKSFDAGDHNFVQYCVGAGGHANYWSDGVAWRAVAREALGVTNGDSTRASEYGICMMERSLAGAIVVVVCIIVAFGTAIWAVTP